MDFVRSTDDSSTDNSNSILYGTLKSSGDSKTVLLDGAETTTPAVMLMDGDVNDRVACMIVNHTLLVTGNLSSPSMSGNQTSAAIIKGNSAAFDYMKTHYASIDSLKAIQGSIDDLTAIAITTDNIEAKVGEFGYLTADSAVIKGKLNTSELEAKVGELGYLKANFANVDKANIGKLFADVGLLTSANIVDGHVTGYLDSVEINANRITAGTLAVEQLMVKDDSGNYKLLSVDEDGNTSYATIDGSTITEHTITADHMVANTITANEINMESLVGNKAFIDAISTNKIVVSTKNSVDDANKTAQDALDKAISSVSYDYAASQNGTTAPTSGWQSTIPVVASGQYLWTRTTTKYMNSSKYADTYSYTVSRQGVDGAKGDPGADGEAGADAISISITSSNGTVFRNNVGSTVLTAHVYIGEVEQTITEEGVCGSIGSVKWYKGNSTTEVATAKSISVLASDVTNSEVYTCQLDG